LRLFFTDTVSSTIAWTEIESPLLRAARDFPERIGKEPQKAYSGQMMFRVDPEVHRKAALAAELAGKSLNAWAEEVLEKAAG